MFIGVVAFGECYGTAAQDQLFPGRAAFETQNPAFPRVVQMEQCADEFGISDFSARGARREIA
jgi:hypothetical protein